MTDEPPNLLPEQVKAEKIEEITDEEITGIIRDYCGVMNLDAEDVLEHTFYKLTPDTDNPYKQMYTNN